MFAFKAFFAALIDDSPVSLVGAIVMCSDEYRRAVGDAQEINLRVGRHVICTDFLI